MVQIEDPKTLSDRIDTNKNNNIETSEIIKFLDKDENVLNLGIILENVFKPRQIWSIDGSQEKAANLIYNAALNATLNNKKFQQKIQNIINKGKGGLGKAEVFLLYIQWHFDGAGGFEELQPIRTKGDLYTRYGGEYLLTYIRRKYKNQKYEFWEGWPNDLLNNPKPIPKSKPTGKDVIPASPKKEIQLPRDISFDMHGEDNTYTRGEFKKLDTWAQKYFLSDYNKAKEASLKRNERKKEKDDYVQLDLFIFALTKYREYVEKQDLTIGKSIFGSQESFYLQKMLAENYLKDLENINKNFPGVGDIIKKLSEYNEELKKIQKKYLGEENEEVVQKKYENYVSAVNQKRKEMGIDKNLCNKEPETSEEAVIFFENMDKIMQFQAEQESIKKTYGEKTINNYENYLNAKGNLTKKYGKDNLQQRINTYNIYKKAVSDCRDKHPGFNVEKYQQYIQELSTSGLLNDFNNLRILSKSLTIKDGNIPNNFPIKSIRDEYEAKKREQAKTDKRWENLKSKSTFLYQVCNIGASALNALRSGTFQLGGKLGALLLSPFFDDDEMVAIWEKTETGARGRHINTSTKQSESLYRDGKITFNWDNGPGIVAESIVNMCLLIEGGGIVGKTVAEGAAKTGINISTKAAQGVGLFTSGFLNNIGTSFQEGFDVGMTGNQALLYATVSSFIQGGLELVSPNEFLLGSGKNLAKSYIKEILKSGNKQSLQAIGKVFLKNVGSEIVEENFQEALQLAAGNLINMRANDQFDLGQISGTETLVADWDPKNFGATAIITTLTTGLVTSGSLAMKTPGMGNTQTREQLISHIQSNPELYQDVTNILDKAIAGNIKIPNVQIQELQNLKRELNVKSINIGNENTDYFDGKPHQFEVTEQQARSNSLNMDNILREINEQNQFEKLQELRENIREQYKKATGENLELTDEQLLSILDAHEQDGIIGELTTGQLKKKVKVLKETVKDSKIRRFLLEAGFCGSEDSDVNLVYMPEDDDVSLVYMPEDDDVSIVNDKYEMDQNDYNFFNNSPKTDKAKWYLDRRFEPQNKINLGNGNYLYVTDKIINSGGRPIIIGYAIENGIINLRFFYRSNSEGCWRSCPGKKDDIYSKALGITNSSYETTTKVDPRIGETFDALTEIPYEYGCPIMESGTIGNEILLEEMKRSILVDKKLFPELHNSAVYFYGKRKSSDVIAGYNKIIPNGLDFQNMKLNPGKSYTYKHDFLGTVNVQVCTIKRNGIDLDFHFSRAINSPDKVRIENVVYSDAKINDFGVYDKQVNAGPLIAKPIDYATQVPVDRQGKRYGENYMDIRDLYQGNPIIQRYKNNIR